MQNAVAVAVVFALTAVACESQPVTAPSERTGPFADSAPVRPQPANPLSATLQHHAMLTDTTVVEVAAELSCPAGYSVIEALLTLAQRDSAAGQGGFAGVVCDGTARRYVARIQPYQGQFRAGPANASGYLLVCDAASHCPSVNFSRKVVIKGGGRAG